MVAGHPLPGERVDLPALLTRLATDAQINEVLGGGGRERLAGALAVGEGLVDEWVIYLAPMLVDIADGGWWTRPAARLGCRPSLDVARLLPRGDDMCLTLR